MTLSFDWSHIETVLLDMDGTLLDRHFDDYFWQQHVPSAYAAKNGLDPATARELLAHRYRREEGKLEWTDLDFWSVELNLDIPKMKTEIEDLIQVHPHVPNFLSFCREAAKKIYLVTNAHSKTVALKMEKTRLESYFDATVCAAEIGMAKEEPVFWRKLAKKLGFSKEKCLLADDTERVLAAAREFGIATLIHMARPSSAAPIQESSAFRSITSFSELIPASHFPGNPRLEKRPLP